MVASPWPLIQDSPLTIPKGEKEKLILFDLLENHMIWNNYESRGNIRVFSLEMQI